MNFDPNWFAFTLAVLGIVGGLFISIWLMRRTFKIGQHSLELTAAAEIRGTASDVRETLQIAVTIRDNVEAVRNALSVPAPTEVSEANGITRLLSLNAPLLRRVDTGIETKLAIGKYLRRRIPRQAVLAVDCGTTTGWAVHEVLRDAPDLAAIVTNNLLVAAMMSGGDGRESLLAQETLSVCRLVPGVYSPDYAAIFPDTEQVGTDALREVGKQVDWVLLGSTSISIESGPRGRSEPNRRFKRALMRWALEHDDVQLAIMCELEKVGLQLGVVCDDELWRQLLGTGRCHILVGCPPPPRGIERDIQVRLSEECQAAQSRDESKDIYKFIALDGSVMSTDKVLSGF